MSGRLRWSARRPWRKRAPVERRRRNFEEEAVGPKFELEIDGNECGGCVVLNRLFVVVDARRRGALQPRRMRVQSDARVAEALVQRSSDGSRLAYQLADGCGLGVTGAGRRRLG